MGRSSTYSHPPKKCDSYIPVWLERETKLHSANKSTSNRNCQCHVDLAFLAQLPSPKLPAVARFFPRGLTRQAFFRQLQQRLQTNDLIGQLLHALFGQGLVRFEIVDLLL